MTIRFCFRFVVAVLAPLALLAGGCAGNSGIISVEASQEPTVAAFPAEPPVPGYPSFTPADRAANIALMLETLGPDWRASGPNSSGEIELVPGSPTARELPDSYTATIHLRLFLADDRDNGLADRCAAWRWEDDGVVASRSACEPSALPDGRVAQLQDVFGNGDPGDTTQAYVERPDGLVVDLSLEIYDRTRRDRQPPAAARAWLERQDATVVTLAADPHVRPVASPAASSPLDPATGAPPTMTSPS